MPPSSYRVPPGLDAPATQAIDDREDYLKQSHPDIGRRLSDHELELFASGDPVKCLEEQLDALMPDFVALHDFGATLTLQLLQLFAREDRDRPQTLTLRSQGQGMPLATITFVEISSGGDKPLRIYSTDVNAEPQLRQRLGQVLLSHSRLAVLLVAETPRQALPNLLRPMREAIARGPWTNNELLFVPLSSMPWLPEEAHKLVDRGGLTVEVAPVPASLKALRPMVVRTWHEAHARLQAPRWDTPTEPMGLRPMPEVLPMPVPGSVDWDEFARRCGGLRGVISCCVFDQHSRAPLAHVGDRPAPARLAELGSQLIQQTSDAGRGLGLGASVRDSVISFAQQQVLLLPLPGHPGVVLVVVVNMRQGSAALVRAQIEKFIP